MSFRISVGIRAIGFLNYTYFVLDGNIFKMEKSLWLLASWKAISKFCPVADGHSYKFACKTFPFLIYRHVTKITVLYIINILIT